MPIMSNKTSHQLKPSLLIVACITGALVLLGLALDVPAILDGGFFSDCATYYALATSLAHDLDIEYQRGDLQRIYADFKGGPSGIFLQRNPNSGRLYYGKAYIYPLVLAGPVKIFGHRGILITHALLLGAVLLGMVLLWERHWGAFRALAVALGFTLPTVVSVYYFWIAPEFFNFCVIFAAYFFWLYKEINPPRPEEDPPRWRAWLLGPWTDWIAGALVGLAIFSKLSNGVMVLPLLVFLLARGKWLRFLAAGLAVALTAGLLFGVQQLVTGHWNYQGGERKSFTREVPFGKELTFDTASQEVKETDPGTYSPPFYPLDIALNAGYFVVGRFGGILPYYFSAVLAIILFFVLGRGRGALFRWLVLAGIVASVAAYIILIPTNYIGGGGTVANRYFMNIMPLFFFLLPLRTPKWMPTAAALGGVLFCGHILLTPYQTSLYPGRYTETPILKLLPVEYTVLNDLPVNVNRERTRVEWYKVVDGKIPPDEIGYPQISFYLYQLDSATSLKNPAPARGRPKRDEEGDWYLGAEQGERAYQQLLTEAGRQWIWVFGGRSGEMILRTGKPIEEIHLTVTNSECNNRVTVSLQGSSTTLALEPREEVTLSFKPAWGFAYHYLSTSYLYHLVVSTTNGVTPRVQEDFVSNDYRYLGVMLEFEVVE